MLVFWGVLQLSKWRKDMCECMRSGRGGVRTWCLLGNPSSSMRVPIMTVIVVIIMTGVHQLTPLQHLLCPRQCSEPLTYCDSWCNWSLGVQDLKVVERGQVRNKWFQISIALWIGFGLGFDCRMMVDYRRARSALNQVYVLEWLFSLHHDGWIRVSCRQEAERAVDRLVEPSRWELWAPESRSSVGNSHYRLTCWGPFQLDSELIFFFFSFIDVYLIYRMLQVFNVCISFNVWWVWTDAYCL